MYLQHPKKLQSFFSLNSVAYQIVLKLYCVLPDGDDDDDDQILHVPVDKSKKIIIIAVTICSSLFFLQLCICILWKKKLQAKGKTCTS